MGKKMPSHADLPYRPCAGTLILNRKGLVWIGRRADEPDSPEGHGTWWQMPQGGIDDGEDPYPAALREAYEETNMRSLSKLGESDWLTYDLPAHLIGVAWKGRYRGQRMKWFALRFEGDDSEIDVLAPGGGKHEPEFTEWRWERLDRLPELVVPFKRKVYNEVLASFRHLAA
jgi:putative (di)nucleoside polyphosphate hydrolase